MELYVQMHLARFVNMVRRGILVSGTGNAVVYQRRCTETSLQPLPRLYKFAGRCSLPQARNVSAMATPRFPTASMCLLSHQGA